jgi:hypothetical protein
MPRTVGSGRKPGNEYVSQSRRRRFDARAIHQSCSNSKSRKMQNPLAISRFLEFSTQKLPTRFYEDPEFLISSAKKTFATKSAQLGRADP